MAEIHVYQNVFGKQGAPISNAQFAQLISQGLFKPTTAVPLAVLPPIGPLRNIYEVSLQTGASGKIRISASGHGSDELDIDNFGVYQVLL